MASAAEQATLKQLGGQVDIDVKDKTLYPVFSFKESGSNVNYDRYEDISKETIHDVVLYRGFTHHFYETARDKEVKDAAVKREDSNDEYKKEGGEEKEQDDHDDLPLYANTTGVNDGDDVNDKQSEERGKVATPPDVTLYHTISLLRDCVEIHMIPVKAIPLHLSHATSTHLPSEDSDEECPFVEMNYRLSDSPLMVEGKQVRQGRIRLGFAQLAHLKRVGGYNRKDRSFWKSILAGVSVVIHDNTVYSLSSNNDKEEKDREKDGSSSTSSSRSSSMPGSPLRSPPPSPRGGQRKVIPVIESNHTNISLDLSHFSHQSLDTEKEREKKDEDGEPGIKLVYSNHNYKSFQLSFHSRDVIVNEHTSFEKTEHWMCECKQEVKYPFDCEISVRREEGHHRRWHVRVLSVHLRDFWVKCMGIDDSTLDYCAPYDEEEDDDDEMENSSTEEGVQESKMSTDQPSARSLTNASKLAEKGDLLKFLVNNLVYDNYSDDFIITTIERLKLENYQIHNIDDNNKYASKHEVRQRSNEMVDEGEREHIDVEIVEGAWGHKTVRLAGEADPASSPPAKHAPISAARNFAYHTQGHTNRLLAGTVDAFSGTREGANVWASAHDDSHTGHSLQHQSLFRRQSLLLEKRKLENPRLARLPELNIIKVALQMSKEKRGKYVYEQILSLLVNSEIGDGDHLEMCSREDLHRLTQHCSLYEVDTKKPKEVVAVKGRAMEYVYIVLNGSVDCDMGGDYVMKKEGEVLGLSALLSSNRACRWDCDIEISKYMSTYSEAPHSATSTSEGAGGFRRGRVNPNAHFQRVATAVAVSSNPNEDAFNQTCMCRIPVKALFKYVGQEGVEPLSYLACFWSFCRLRKELERAFYVSVFEVPRSDKVEGQYASMKEEEEEDEEEEGYTNTSASATSTTGTGSNGVTYKKDHRRRSLFKFRVKNRGNASQKEADRQALMRSRRLFDKEIKTLQLVYDASAPSFVAFGQIPTLDALTDSDKREEMMGRLRSYYQRSFDREEEEKRIKNLEASGLVVHKQVEKLTSSLHEDVGGQEGGGLFGDIGSQIDRLKLHEIGRMKAYQQGDIVYHQGSRRFHFYLITKGECSVFRRLSRHPYIEVDLGIKLVAGDFICLEGAGEDWIDEQRSFLKEEGKQICSNGYEYFERAHSTQRSPLFGRHTNTLVALTCVTLITIPLYEIAKSYPVMCQLLNRSSDKYSMCQCSNREVLAKYTQALVWKHQKDGMVQAELSIKLQQQRQEASGGGNGTAGAGAGAGAGEEEEGEEEARVKNLYDILMRPATTAATSTAASDGDEAVVATGSNACSVYSSGEELTPSTAFLQSSSRGSFITNTTRGRDTFHSLLSQKTQGLPCLAEGDGVKEESSTSGSNEDGSNDGQEQRARPVSAPSPMRPAIPTPSSTRGRSVKAPVEGDEREEGAKREEEEEEVLPMVTKKVSWDL